MAKPFFKRMFGGNQKKEEAPKDSNFIFEIDSSHISDIVTEFKKPFVDSHLPWRTNSDWDFISKLYTNGVISRSLNLREAYAITERIRFNWENSFPNFSLDRPYIDQILMFIFKNRGFDLKWAEQIIWKSILTGLEGLFQEYAIRGGWYCPSTAYHIDNRRFKYYKQTTSDSKDKRLLGIRDGVDMEVRPLSATEKSNMIIMLYKPFEYTFGYGQGIALPLYYLWRAIAILEMIISTFTEKYSIPLVAVSVPSNVGTMGSTNSAGEALISVLKKHLHFLRDKAGGAFFGLSTPAQFDILDIGAGKLEDMLSLHKHLSKIIADLILFSGESQLATNRSHGAGKSATNLSKLAIEDDREYIQRHLNKIMERVFVLNEFKFRELGVNSVDELPLIELVYEQLDPSTRIEIFESVQSQGFEITGEAIERSLEVDLVRDASGQIIRNRTKDDAPVEESQNQIATE